MQHHFKGFFMKLIILAFAAFVTIPSAQAKTFNEKLADTMTCGDAFLLRDKGIPTAQAYRYYNVLETNVGGPTRFFFTRYMTSCLIAKGYKVGDTSRIGTPEGVPFEQALIAIQQLIQ